MTDRTDAYTWQPRDIKLSQCFYCRHKNDGAHCDAFPRPQFIPNAILRGQFDHRQPYPGDHGIQFAPVSDEAARTVDGMFREEER